MKLHHEYDTSYDLRIVHVLKATYPPHGGVVERWPGISRLPPPPTAVHMFAFSISFIRNGMWSKVGTGKGVGAGTAVGTWMGDGGGSYLHKGVHVQKHPRLPSSLSAHQLPVDSNLEHLFLARRPHL